MKIKSKILSSLILLIAVLLSGCFGNENSNQDSAKGVRITRTGNGLFVMAAGSFEGIEIEIDRAVSTEDMKIENLAIVKKEKNKTIISIVKPSKEVSEGELLFAIYNENKGLNIKVNEIITSAKADEIYKKEAKNIAKRAVGDILVGDFNIDGIVDVTDFNLFKEGYGVTYGLKYDIAPALMASSDSKWSDIYSKSTPDGNINILDFIIFGRNYGKTNPDVNVKSISLSGESTVKEGKTIALTATVTYTNGTTSTADVLTWTTSDAAKATVANGTVTGVSAGTAVITVTKDSISTTKTITIEKTVTGLVMYLKKPAGWSGTNAYVWKGTGTSATRLSAAWPGTVMTPVSGRDGWYSVTLDGAETPANVVFNGNGTDAQKTADLSCTTQEAWYDAAWIPNPWQPQPPTVTISGGGTYPAGTYDLTVNVTGDDVTVIKYTKDGTDPKTNGTTIANGGKISVTITEGSSLTIKVYAENSIGGTTAETLIKQGEQAKATFSWRNATVYFVLTDRFVNGDKSNDNSYGREKDASGNVIPGYENKIGTFHGGDLKGLTSKVEEGYFNDLGINAIWITAPYEQMHGGLAANGFKHYGYHGYYALDFSNIDANMGTEADFKAFVDSAHKKGIRVIMDIVLNHSGYMTAKDAEEYGIGALATNWKDIYYNWNHSKYQWYNDYAEIAASKGSEGMLKKDGDWSTNWWGPSWIRMVGERFNGYNGVEGSGIDTCVDGLPDFKTETRNDPGIPGILKLKWTREGRYDKEVKELDDYFKRTGRSRYVTTYLGKWLTDWVREYGVDGFRCDTVKHVDKSEWKTLKEMGVEALKEWRKNNPTAPGADWTDDFWMTGEHWNWGPGTDEGYFSNGLDNMINFNFQGASGSVGSALEGIYSGYASYQYGLLSYISSHDKNLSRGDMINRGTALLLCPNGVQIFYGDETNRPAGGGPQYEPARSSMNWNSIDKNVQSHWQKIGQFRRNHVAVGAGAHKQISASPYTFSRIYSKNGVEDKIVAVAGANGSVAVDVSSVFTDGTSVRNAYDGASGTVSGGKVTFTAGNGVILIEKQ
jgi:glycosidase